MLGTEDKVVNNLNIVLDETFLWFPYLLKCITEN